MRYGYWLPVFGGWLRNVDDEGMEAIWDYAHDLAVSAEAWGYSLTLVAELGLNDIKGVGAPLSGCVVNRRRARRRHPDAGDNGRRAARVPSPGPVCAAGDVG